MAKRTSKSQGITKLHQAPRFDMAKKPIRQRFYLKPLTWALSYPDVIKHRLTINKKGMEGIKGPYLLLCTHMAFLDFKVTTAALFPQRASYVVAIDGFLNREWLLRNAGGICKRKFTNDIQLIRQIRHVLVQQKTILALYPEARYSLVGTNAVLPEALGKMAKLLGFPVVMLNMHGHYLNSPCWNLTKRGNRIEADMTLLYSAEDLSASSAKEINSVINEAFTYDEYRWQKENKIIINHPKRAEGLHKVLYQCPHCLTEYEMESKGTHLWCNHCKKRWKMSELGELTSVGLAFDESVHVTEFTHIPSWYEFEREQVRKEIERGSYHIEVTSLVEALPNARGYIPLGGAQLTHSMEGFLLEGVFDGEVFSLSKPILSMYSCHIEFNYFGKGDCIDLSTLNDTYYIYPQGEAFSVTKMALATEELYAYAKRLSTS